MDHFRYREGCLWAEGVSLEQIADTCGTPCYVYSRATLERHWRAFDKALEDRRHLVCFAVKSNSNLAVLQVLARLGSGFDIVSAGELERVLHAGGDPATIVFSGVGKRAAEMRRALQSGILCFNIESREELLRLNEVARSCGQNAPISVRVNPDVDAGTHPYISTGLRENKFGIDAREAVAVYQLARELPNIDVTGVACHIGSQLLETKPFVDALDRVLDLVRRLSALGINLRHLDLGGGLGIGYQPEDNPPAPADYVRSLLERIGDLSLEIVIEPGRAIAGNAGILLTRVEYLKHTSHRNFAVVDAAMNDLLRPALYSAWHEIVPVHPRDDADEATFDVVGPVCETGDFLGRNRNLKLRSGDLLAIRSAGAYGFTMSSNYNSRLRPPEIIVDGEHLHVARERERLEDLFAREHLISM
jgi:diaminopimelate decarboxylase